MSDLTIVEKPAEWDRLKALVLDSVSSPITKRVYNMALDEFLAWFQREPRSGFTKATVSAWRVSLEERKLGSSSIIIRMSAIRKLAAEAADNGLLAPELAAGISRVKSAETVGVRTRNWLSLKQAQALLSEPDVSTKKGLRDRAMLAVLLGCGLRRSEVAALTLPIFSSGTGAGASWTYEVSTTASERFRCRPGLRWRSTRGLLPLSLQMASSSAPSIAATACKPPPWAKRPSGGRSRDMLATLAFRA